MSELFNPTAEQMVHQDYDYYLDIRGFLDGAEADTTEGYGTFDDYINGELVANDVSSYKNAWPSGTL